MEVRVTAREHERYIWVEFRVKSVSSSVIKSIMDRYNVNAENYVFMRSNCMLSVMLPRRQYQSIESILNEHKDILKAIKISILGKVAGLPASMTWYTI